MKRIAILLLWIYSFVPAFSQQAGVYATLDTNQILIGDQIDFTITCIQNESYDVKFPVFTDTIMTGIEIIDTLPRDTVSNDNGQFTIEKKYTITSFDSGAYMLPVGPFIINDDTVFGKSMFLSVNTMEIDTATAAVKPLKLPYKQGYDIEEFSFMIWILLAVAVLLAAFFIFRKYFKKKDESTVPSAPKEPGFIIALRALDDLKLKQLWEKEQYKQYYTELTDILRQYIENHFHIPALEVTSFEILQHIKQKYKLDKDAFAILEKTLTTADLVKFAKHIPDPDTNNLMYRDAYVFVDKTKFYFDNNTADAANEGNTVNTNTEEK